MPCVTFYMLGLHYRITQCTHLSVLHYCPNDDKCPNWEEAFISVFIQRVAVLDPVALLQIAVSAQKLHVTCCTCSALAVRDDVIKL